jgi:hypothetical protein
MGGAGKTAGFTSGSGLDSGVRNIAKEPAKTQVAKKPNRDALTNGLMGFPFEC